MASGTTVPLTTHCLEEAEALAGRVAILRQGSIVASGTSSQVTGAYGQRNVSGAPSARRAPVTAVAAVQGPAAEGGPFVSKSASVLQEG
ncbi:hypothetical protein ACFO3J_20680 [Streptomyces polygonati]|uniref:ABC transporter ATP-binding protein n=1 Tax=Streptomyces polygonati TaxID=1617087 RepID=A0ABV8HPC5_9ACTN